MGKKAIINKEVERVIRPIVEGQIRGFLKEHPSILKGVDWYKPRTDKAKTLTNSLAKRIVRDLACGNTTARLAAALVASDPASRPNPVCGIVAADKKPRLQPQVAWAGFLKGLLTVFRKSATT